MSLVTSEKDNGMGIITFNNPPKGFLTSEMIAETISLAVVFKSDATKLLLVPRIPTSNSLIDDTMSD